MHSGWFNSRWFSRVLAVGLFLACLAVCVSGFLIRDRGGWWRILAAILIVVACGSGNGVIWLWIRGGTNRR